RRPRRSATRTRSRTTACSSDSATASSSDARQEDKEGADIGALFFVVVVILRSEATKNLFSLTSYQAGRTGPSLTLRMTALHRSSLNPGITSGRCAAFATIHPVAY